MKRIAENTYLLDECGVTDRYLLVGEKKALLIDVGTGFDNLYEQVREITDLPLIVACTHNHTDHLGGYGDFNEIYIHEDDYNNLLKFTLTRFARIIFLLSSKENLTQEVPICNVRKSKNNLNLIPLKDGFVFDLGGRKVTLKHFTGHTLGSSVFLDDKTKIMFVGDNVCPSLWLFLPKSSSVEAWIDSAKSILRLCDEYTPWWGHEQGLLSPEIIKRDIECAYELLEKYPKNRFFSKIKAYPSNDRVNGSIVFRTGHVHNHKKENR